MRLSVIVTWSENDLRSCLSELGGIRHFDRERCVPAFKSPSG